MKPLLFHFPEDRIFAGRLAELLDADEGSLSWHRFPDRESLVTLETGCDGREVIFVCGLTDPDSKALPLYFSAATARSLGARRVGLVAPYLAYMRQDQQFVAGQTRSAQEFGRFLSGSFDWLTTVDPHLHRIRSLADVLTIPGMAVGTVPAIAEWIRRSVAAPVIIGPDKESAQWVEPVARSLGAPWTVLEKSRSGDLAVTVSAVDRALIRGHHPVVIDDIVSSGHTLAAVLRELAPLNAAPATCVIVHAVFSAGAEAALHEAGESRIVSTNTVPHPTNRIDVAPLVATAIGTLLAN